MDRDTYILKAFLHFWDTCFLVLLSVVAISHDGISRTKAFPLIQFMTLSAPILQKGCHTLLWHEALGFFPAAEHLRRVIDATPE